MRKQKTKLEKTFFFQQNKSYLHLNFKIKNCRSRVAKENDSSFN